jgi:hypothetical protein
VDAGEINTQPRKVAAYFLTVFQGYSPVRPFRRKKLQGLISLLLMAGGLKAAWTMAAGRAPLGLKAGPLKSAIKLCMRLAAMAQTGMTSGRSGNLNSPARRLNPHTSCAG